MLKIYFLCEFFIVHMLKWNKTYELQVFFLLRFRVEKLSHDLKTFPSIEKMCGV